MRINRVAFLFLFWCFLGTSNDTFGQHTVSESPDSLKEKKYKYLYDRFDLNRHDTVLSKLYLNAYLNKATLADHKINKAIALNQLSYYEVKDSDKLRLIKQSLVESNAIDSLFSVETYNNLGIYYYERFDYEQALPQYLKAFELSKKRNYKDYEIISLNNIADIKADIGEHKDALNLYKRCYSLEKNRKDANDLLAVGLSLNLSESFRYNRQHDSASYYYHSIINKVHKNYAYALGRALINEGINLYYKKNLVEAELQLNEGISKVNLNDKDDLKYYVLANYYLGKILQTYQEEKGVAYFLNVDSLLTKENIVVPEVREAYIALIEYSKRKKDRKQQISYLNKLVRFNEIVSARNIKTSYKINTEYDTPQLLKTRDALIRNLETRNQSLIIEKISLVFVLLIVVVLLIIHYRKQKIYKKRFDDIIKKIDSNTTSKKEVVKSNDNTNTISKLTLDPQLVEDVLERLQVFEAKKGYLKNTITITSLARKLSTNRKYLSQIINVYKKKSFTSYINDLRINYVLHELHINSKLQKYTTLGIAKEIGFNSVDSFTRAFKKKTGISPSYYLRKIRNKEKETVVY